jgi:hypothetical protein
MLTADPWLICGTNTDRVDFDLCPDTGKFQSSEIVDWRYSVSKSSVSLWLRLVVLAHCLRHRQAKPLLKSLWLASKSSMTRPVAVQAFPCWRFAQADAPCA